ncbi:bifunctional diguanylate cyclase/phosphodiesterase [soil metagenome]
MLELNRANIRFLLNIVLPALVVLVGTVAIVIISLKEMASAVDRTEIAATQRAADAAIQATARRMSGTHRDYARWDDAARKLYGKIDPDFVKDNYVSSTEDPVFFDTAYLVDRAGNRLFAYRHGGPVNLSVTDAFGPDMPRMIAGLPTDDSAYAVHSGYVRGAWGLMVAAVGPVTSFTRQAGKPRDARYLIVAKSFDDEAVRVLASDYLIDGLRLVQGSAPAAGGTTLRGPFGTELAGVAWDVREPGNAAFGAVTPSTVAMLGILSVTVFLLVALAAHGIVRVQKGEAQARHAAMHDSLSGLPNRDALVQSLTASIAALDRDGAELGILYLDLDGFKQVNDTYGHEAGDQLLRKVAAGFELLTGDRLLVRLGGDEFAVVIVGRRVLDAATELAEHLLRFFAKPLDIGGRIVSIGTSVGIAFVTGSDVTAEEAIRRADVAMYQAKQLGRNRICVFDDSLDALRIKRMAIAADLRRALARDELALAYQPIFDAHGGHVAGVEALLRWPRNDDSKQIPPAEFIPIAEETGLIDELGQWTLRRACEDARAWPGLKVAVNVSPAQFQSPNFATAVAAVLAEVGLPAARLEIEVTETYFIARPEQARKAIDAVRALGVLVALDDFGTGYSSIGYLRSFSFDKLKLDRSLIVGIDRDSRVQQLTQATIGLARALNLSVTAEGVETEEEATMLRLVGCDQLQGFFFGRLSPAAEITALLGTDARLTQPQLALTA